MPACARSEVIHAHRKKQKGARATSKRSSCFVCMHTEKSKRGHVQHQSVAAALYACTQEKARGHMQHQRVAAALYACTVWFSTNMRRTRETLLVVTTQPEREYGTRRLSGTAHTHTHTHTYTHIYKYTHIHMHTHTNTHTCRHWQLPCVTVALPSSAAHVVEMLLPADYPSKENALNDGMLCRKRTEKACAGLACCP